MSDSSNLFPINTIQGCSVLQTNQDQISLYVPVIPPTLHFSSSSLSSEETQDAKSMRFQPKFLKYYIENCMRIGKVRRIDFTSREVAQYTTPQVCAFIHFDCFYDNDTTKDMLACLDRDGKYRSFGFENDNNSYIKFGGPHSRPHLLFKINHKPIDSPKEYDRNIEQVMAENKLLIERLQEKEELLRQVSEHLQEWDSNQDPNVVIALSGLRKIMGDTSVVEVEL